MSTHDTSPNRSSERSRGLQFRINRLSKDVIERDDDKDDSAAQIELRELYRFVNKRSSGFHLLTLEGFGGAGKSEILSDIQHACRHGESTVVLRLDVVDNAQGGDGVIEENNPAHPRLDWGMRKAIYCAKGCDPNALKGAWDKETGFLYSHYLPNSRKRFTGGRLMRMGFFTIVTILGVVEKLIDGSFVINGTEWASWALVILGPILAMLEFVGYDTLTDWWFRKSLRDRLGMSTKQFCEFHEDTPQRDQPENKEFYLGNDVAELARVLARAMLLSVESAVNDNKCCVFLLIDLQETPAYPETREALNLALPQIANEMIVFAEQKPHWRLNLVVAHRRSEHYTILGNKQMVSLPVRISAPEFFRQESEKLLKTFCTVADEQEGIDSVRKQEAKSIARTYLGLSGDSTGRSYSSKPIIVSTRLESLYSNLVDPGGRPLSADMERTYHDQLVERIFPRAGGTINRDLIIIMTGLPSFDTYLLKNVKDGFNSAWENLVKTNGTFINRWFERRVESLEDGQNNIYLPRPELTNLVRMEAADARLLSEYPEHLYRLIAVCARKPGRYHDHLGYFARVLANDPDLLDAAIDKSELNNFWTKVIKVDLGTEKEKSKNTCKTELDKFIHSYEAVLVELNKEVSEFQDSWDGGQEEKDCDDHVKVSITGLSEYCKRHVFEDKGITTTHNRSLLHAIGLWGKFVRRANFRATSSGGVSPEYAKDCFNHLSRFFKNFAATRGDEKFLPAEARLLLFCDYVRHIGDLRRKMADEKNQDDKKLLEEFHREWYLSKALFPENKEALQYLRNSLYEIIKVLPYFYAEDLDGLIGSLCEMPIAVDDRSGGGNTVRLVITLAIRQRMLLLLKASEGELLSDMPDAANTVLLNMPAFLDRLLGYLLPLNRLLSHTEKSTESEAFETAILDCLDAGDVELLKAFVQWLRCANHSTSWESLTPDLVMADAVEWLASTWSECQSKTVLTGKLIDILTGQGGIQHESNILLSMPRLVRRLRAKCRLVAFAHLCKSSKVNDSELPREWALRWLTLSSGKTDFESIPSNDSNDSAMMALLGLSLQQDKALPLVIVRVTRLAGKKEPKFTLASTGQTVSFDVAENGKVKRGDDLPELLSSKLRNTLKGNNDINTLCLAAVRKYDDGTCWVTAKGALFIRQVLDHLIDYRQLITEPQIYLGGSNSKLHLTVDAITASFLKQIPQILIGMKFTGLNNVAVEARLQARDMIKNLEKTKRAVYSNITTCEEVIRRLEVEAYLKVSEFGSTRDEVQYAGRVTTLESGDNGSELLVGDNFGTDPRKLRTFASLLQKRFGETFELLRRGEWVDRRNRMETASGLARIHEQLEALAPSCQTLCGLDFEERTRLSWFVFMDADEAGRKAVRLPELIVLNWLPRLVFEEMPGKSLDISGFKEKPEKHYDSDQDFKVPRLLHPALSDLPDLKTLTSEPLEGDSGRLKLVFRFNDGEELACYAKILPETECSDGLLFSLHT